jgi:hypothetical protein
MAYPGVGILAGDSLQYLSIVTAHAVIMVFFMIMPLLFGAFGNFLLPTQLGVHDVAFPRLNSVAFWFLPGGLIMLAQLICLDRRYQRMNCFNIREIQTLLKARFYADLLNETDHRLFLAQTAIGLRFKLQDINFFNPSMLLLNRFNLLAVDNDRSQLFTSKSLTTNNIYSGKYNQFNDTRTVSSIDTHSTPTYYLFVSLFNPTQTVSFYLGNPISTFVNLVFQIIVKASCKVVYTFTTIIELLSFKTSF